MANTLQSTSGAPSWQVDIPNLSQLILGAGAQGLKQLALSGVDIHAIGCMLMIGEFTPTSDEFRKSLKRCREAQRSERLWMYKVVEYGSGQNFLADNLLKTRAGENVMALVTAISAVMSEDASLAVLNRLFEISGAALKDIPGLGQLSNVRSSLLPFAKKMDFKDRLLKYHAFLWGLLQKGGPPTGDDPYDGIPDESSIASIIELLHKLTTSEDDMRLVFCGIKGAAWVATYARVILGLEVSAIGVDRVPIPLFGTHETAKVSLELFHSHSKCELYKEGNVQSFLKFDAISENARKGWSVDCKNFDFVDYNHPDLRKTKIFSRISDFVAMETINQVSELAAAFTDFKQIQALKGQMIPSGFTSYTFSILPHLQHRSLEILWILGFRPGTLSDYFFEPSEKASTSQCIGCAKNEVDVDLKKGGHNKTYCDCKDRRDHCGKDSCYCIEQKTACTRLCHSIEGYSKEDKQSESSTLRQVSNLIRCENEFLLPKFKGNYLPSGGVLDDSDPSLFRLEWYLSPLGEPKDFMSWSKHLRKEISSTVTRAVEFASKLSFTDWDTSIQLISARFIRHRQMKSDNTPVSLSSGKSFDSHLLDAILLCTDSIDAATMEQRQYTEDWLAYDLDGIIVLRNFAHTQSLGRLKGKFLTFFTGRIAYEDAQVSTVRSDEASSQSNLNIQIQPETTNVIGDQAPISTCPKSVIENLSFRPLVKVLKGTLWLRLEVSFNNKQRGLACPARIARAIPRLLVTVTSQKEDDVLHSYCDDLPNPSVWAPGTVRKWYSGFSFMPPSSGGLIMDLKFGAFVCHQAVTEHPEAQWLACQWQAESSKSLIILRRYSCMACVIRALHPLILEMFDLSCDERVQICIVDGRGQNEALKPCWGASELGRGLEAIDPKLRSDYNEGHYEVWRYR
ncbi:MAG: hypothetical protein M1814_003585 [Vezdaea aestivalis]|nr:MAG: hypothetical protein M1814_003585 [Vezdaea aestivalis]